MDQAADSFTRCTRGMMMPSLRDSEGGVPTFYDQLVRIMEANGCMRVPGGKGSHEKWRNPANGKLTTVPRSKSRHTANAVLKQLGLTDRF